MENEPDKLFTKFVVKPTNTAGKTPPSIATSMVPIQSRKRGKPKTPTSLLGTIFRRIPRTIRRTPLPTPIHFFFRLSCIVVKFKINTVLWSILRKSSRISIALLVICLQKFTNKNAETRLSGRRLRNPLILNDLRALFEKKNPTKSTPFSIILAS